MSNFKRTKSNNTTIWAITYNVGENEALITAEPKYTFGKRTKLFYGDVVEAETMFNNLK